MLGSIEELKRTPQPEVFDHLTSWFNHWKGKSKTELFERAREYSETKGIMQYLDDLANAQNLDW